MVKSDRLLPAVDATIGAMSEPMVSHGCVAFYLLSEEVSRSVTVVQSGQGADEVFAGYDWYPPLASVPRGEAAAAYAEVFVDRPHAELADLLEPEWLASCDIFHRDHSRAFIDAHFDAPGADTALDAALRLDTSVMLVDDPVKRVDNMSMAWGLEARVPFLDHELVELRSPCWRCGCRAGASSLPGLDWFSWLAAETCTSPALSPDGTTLAVVSDRDGIPRVWLSRLGRNGPPARLDTGDDYVRVVSWSPDGEWLCLVTAAAGGERTVVRAVRPNGSDGRVVAGSPAGVAYFGPWQPGGHVVGLAESTGADPTRLTAYAVDVCSGRRRRLASGPAATVCTLSHDGRYAVVRIGARGARRLLLVDTRTGSRAELLGADATIADARFAPDSQTIYLHTDAHQEFAALLAPPRVGAGHPEAARLIAARAEAELDSFALDPTGRAVLAVWNVEGYSELELVDLADGQRRALPVPAEVVTGCAFARSGESLILAVESRAEPPHVLRYPLPPTEPVRLAPELPPPWPQNAVARPELHRWRARDGLMLNGWLYRPVGALGAVPTLVWLHGGPEAQQRPTFNPLYQALLACGIAVFAPNARGSSGFGRRFVDADVHRRRFAPSPTSPTWSSTWWKADSLTPPRSAAPAVPTAAT